MLLLAALLKGYQLATGPVLGEGSFCLVVLLIVFLERAPLFGIRLRARQTSVRNVGSGRPGSDFHPSVKERFLLIALLGATFGCSRNLDGDASMEGVAIDQGSMRKVENRVTRGGDPTLRPNHVKFSRSVAGSSNCDDVPTPAPAFPHVGASVSACCHILLYYGLGTTDLPSFASGALALKAITDERTAFARFGKSPFVTTRYGLRYHLFNGPVFHSAVGEVHRDQCLATFATLDLLLDTPVSLKDGLYSLSDLLSDSVAHFSLDQKEIAWTTIAYTKYLPPQMVWANRFGEQTSFSQLARCLVHRDLQGESCAGIHILQALIQIDNLDNRFSVLEYHTRDLVDSWLTSHLRDIIGRQHNDGSWDWQWCESINDIEGMTPLWKKLLVSGHLLETLNSLDSRRRPDDVVYLRAAEWLKNSLDRAEIPADGSWICPFTHAARSAKNVFDRQAQ